MCKYVEILLVFFQKTGYSPRMSKKRFNTTLDRKLVKAVKKLAIDLEKSANDLIEEGISYVLNKYKMETLHGRVVPKRITVPPESDKRQHPRAEVSWPVVVLGVDTIIKGEVKNISSEGALIYCGELPSLNLEQSYELRMKAKHNYDLSVMAYLVRFDIYDNLSATFPYGLGFRFLEISQENLIFLNENVLVSSE